MIVAETTEIQQLDVTKIHAGANDRTVFGKDELASLADNIREHGLIQPITVRPAGSMWEIIAGERRFRAVKSLGWARVPAIVKQMSDEAASAVMLAENVARADLDPIDEAKAYDSRMKLFGWSVDRCASEGGVHPSRIHNRMRLLGLRDELQQLVRTGALKEGWAVLIGGVSLDGNRQMIALRALMDNPSPQVAWLKKLVGDLYEQQCTEPLFDMSAVQVVAAQAVENAMVSAPSPGETVPPTVATDCGAIVDEHIEFWSNAAARWQAQGTLGKQRECLAAVAALTNVKEALA